MAPLLRLLFYYLWVAPHVLQIVVLVALLKRGLYRRIPVFTTYTAFGVCQFLALFLVSQSSIRASYFQVSSFGLGISAALRFGVIFEIFACVFANQGALGKVSKPLFRWTTVTFLIIALSFAVYTHRLDTDPTWFTVLVLERSANIVLCGLILAVFLFSAYLGLRWSRLVFGIALGLGVLCSVDLALAAVESQIGYSAHLALDLVDMAAYHCSALIWLFYVLVPERRPPDISDKVSESDLKAWNNELESLLTR